MVVCQRLGAGDACIFDPQDCGRRFQSRMQWLQHAINDHGAPFVIEKLSFPDRAAFDAWRHHLHQVRGLRFDRRGKIYSCAYYRSPSALHSASIRKPDAINSGVTPEVRAQASCDRCYSFFQIEESEDETIRVSHEGFLF